MKKFILIILGFVTLNLSAGNIAVKAFVTNPSCNGGNNGSIVLSLYGGVAPFTFAWSNSLPANSAQTFLTAGTYSVTVTDNTHNQTTATIEVVDPKKISLSVTVQNTSVTDLNSGEVNLYVDGGTPGYDYQWDNTSTNQNLWGVQAGTYSVVVTDASGCTASTSATIHKTLMMPVASSYSMISSNDNGREKAKNVTTGVNDVTTETNNNLVVYPNPATNVVNVKGIASGSEVSIIDLNGQVISTEKSNTAEAQLNVSNLANGNYVMIVNNGGVTSNKIITIAK